MRQTGAGALVMTAALLTACTSHSTASAPSPTPSPQQVYVPASAVVPLLTVTSLEVGPRAARVVPHGATFDVGKRTQGAQVTLRETVLAFRPVAGPGRCITKADLAVFQKTPSDPGQVRAYPSAALSLARGQLPPAGSGGPSVLIDNQPAADPSPGEDGRQHFDVTELVARWADGGPFPSTGRSVPVGSPVVLNLRPPAADDGSYTVNYALSPRPELVVTRQPGCS